jgi:hypothetical protein
MPAHLAQHVVVVTIVSHHSRELEPDWRALVAAANLAASRFFWFLFLSRCLKLIPVYLHRCTQGEMSLLRGLHR